MSASPQPDVDATKLKKVRKCSASNPTGYIVLDSGQSFQVVRWKGRTYYLYQDPATQWWVDEGRTHVFLI